MGKTGIADYPRKLVLVLCICVVCFVLLPGIIYCSSYIPYINEPGGTGSFVQSIADNQVYMLDYHSTLKESHPFESVWWTWPIMVRPIWYYSGADLPASLKASVVSFGNPLIWWVGIPCLIAAFFIAFRKRDRKMSLVFAAFIFQYAPWILIERATFIYHYFSSLPFIILSIVYVIQNMLVEKLIPKAVLWSYLGAVMLLFVIYYPILSGLPVSTEYANALRLFSSWIW